MTASIFLYVPNVIGILRIGAGLLSFCFMSNFCTFAATLYFFSALLDAVDGFTARTFNQCTRFGAILDQLTDRCLFLGLLLNLVRIYPSLTLFFLFIALVDISCHWIYLHACNLIGKASHKSESQNYVLNLYYTNKILLTLLCVANEAFFIALYLFHCWTSYAVLLVSVMTITGPLMLFKTWISLLHGYTASLLIAQLDIAERSKKG